MGNDTTNHFGKVLMTDVRDKVMRQTMGIVSGSDTSKFTQRYRDFFEHATPEHKQLLSEMLIYQADVVLSFVLGMLADRSDVRMMVSTSSGTVDLAQASDGLDGELWSSNGWIARFSQYGSPLVSED